MWIKKLINRILGTKEPTPEPDLLYYIMEDKSETFIKCMTCGSESYSPSDIKYKYCVKCNIFHETGLKRNTPGQTK